MVTDADGNVVFKTARASGRIAGGEVSAVLEASGVKAYGLMADSLRLVNVKVCNAPIPRYQINLPRL